MKFRIRPIERSDAEKFHFAFKRQGWNKPAVQFLEYYKQQRFGRRKVFVAECDGEVLGYITLMPEAVVGPFADKGIPEIVDFNVLKAYQRNGVGTALMDAAEYEAAKKSDCVCLGVGLHSGYGAAQKMYAKRGYIPDGSGVWWNHKPLPPYEPCVNDDGLVLYLSKELK